MRSFIWKLKYVKSFLDKHGWNKDSFSIAVVCANEAYKHYGPLYNPYTAFERDSYIEVAYTHPRCSGGHKWS